MNWYKARKYRHFDSPLSEAQATAIAGSPSSVSSNSFFPFLRFELAEFRGTKHEWRRSKKRREILVASHRDAHIFAFYASRLRALHEQWLLDRGLGGVVLAFRPSNQRGKTLGLRAKNNIYFARHAFSRIKYLNECQVIGVDVASFFKEIPHEAIKRAWTSLINMKALPKDQFAVFKNLTRYAWVDRERARVALEISRREMVEDRPRRLCSVEEFREKIRGAGLVRRNESKRGIPQGSPISATVSNIVMMDFDSEVAQFAKTRGGFYLRYCDDILLVVPGNDLDPGGLVAYLETQLSSKLGLKLAGEKTEIHSYANGVLKSAGAPSAIQYLGFVFDGGRVLLRPKTLRRYHRRLERSIWLARASAAKANGKRKKLGLPLTGLRRKKIYDRFSHLGAGKRKRGNFIGYGLRAARIMKSRSLKRQVARQWRTLHRKLES